MEVMTTLERQIQRNRRLLESDPNNVDLMLTYALDCLRRDLRFEALVTFQKAIQLKDTADAHLALAQIFYLQSLYRESYEELRRVFKLDSINIGAHVLLHLLKDKESIPDDLVPRLAFVPSRSALGDEMINASNERDLYRREVQEYEAIAASGVNDPEPIVLYCLGEAKKRVERINVNLKIMSRWELLAIDMPGFLPEEKSDLVDKSEAASSAESEEVESVQPQESSVEIEAVAAVETEAEIDAEAEESHTKKTKKSKRRRAKERHTSAVAETEQVAAVETTEPAAEVETEAAVAEETTEAEISKTAETLDTTSIEAEQPVAVKIEQPVAEDESTVSEVADIVEEVPAVAVTLDSESPKNEVAEVVSSEIEVPAADLSVVKDEQTEDKATATEPESVSDDSTTEVIEVSESEVAVAEEPAAVEEVPELPSEEELAKEASFNEFLASMCKIKGSVRAMVLTARGRLAAIEGEFEQPEETAARVAGFLKGVCSDGKMRLITFVSESKNSSVILQQINDTYYMLVDGRSVTLGVLRQRAERCKTELAGLC